MDAMTYSESAGDLLTEPLTILPTPPAPAPPASDSQARCKSATENTKPKSGGRGGAPFGNQNATRHGHRGSTMPKQISKNGKTVGLGEEDIVNDRMAATLASWDQKNGTVLSEDGKTVVRPPAVDAVMMQIRRAHERDRMAAKFLRDGKFLDGSKLTLDQQNEQREIQAAALRTIETCLNKLGIGLNTAAATDPWAAALPDLPALPPVATASPPHGLATVNAPEKPGRFSGDSKPP